MVDVFLNVAEWRNPPWFRWFRRFLQFAVWKRVWCL